MFFVTLLAAYLTLFEHEQSPVTTGTLSRAKLKLPRPLPPPNSHGHGTGSRCEELVASAKDYRSTDFARNGEANVYLAGHLVPSPVERGVFQLASEVVASIEAECEGALGENLLPDEETAHCVPPETANVDKNYPNNRHDYEADPWLSKYAAHAWLRKCIPFSYGSMFRDITFAVSGPGVSTAIAGKETYINIAYDPPSQSSPVAISIRLVGPTIVAAKKDLDDPRDMTSPIIAEYVVRDPGLYVLEVMLVDVHGDPVGVTHMVYQGLVHIKLGAEALPDSTQKCSGLIDKVGRWVYFDSTISDFCPTPLCSSDKTAEDPTYWKKYLIDELNLNNNYVWTPYDCHYHIYSKPELLSCFSKCGYDKPNAVGFNEADSLGREIFFNLAQMLGTGKLDGRDFKEVNESGNSLETEGGTLLWGGNAYESEKVFVYAPALVMKYYAKQGSYSRNAVSKILYPDLDYISKVKSDTSKLNIVNVNSLIQYTNPRDTKPMPRGKSPQRRHDMEYMTEAIKKAALEKDLTILDTASRCVRRVAKRRPVRSQFRSR